MQEVLTQNSTAFIFDTYQYDVSHLEGFKKTFYSVMNYIEKAFSMPYISNTYTKTLTFDKTGKIERELVQKNHAKFEIMPHFVKNCIVYCFQH